MMQFLGRCSRNWFGVFAIIFAVVVFSASAMAQPVDPFPQEAWHNVYDFAGYNDAGNGVAIDSNSNVVVVGYRGTEAAGTPHGQGMNAYMRKYDHLGAFVCEIEVMGPGTPPYPEQREANESFYDVAIDSQDNIIVAGTISGDYYIGGYYVAPYLNKYYPNCPPVWGSPAIYKYPGDSAWQASYSVTLDANDNIYTTGAVFAGWGGPEHEWATWKYDANGALQNGFPILYDYSPTYQYVDYSYDVAVDSLGNIIVVGIRGQGVGNYDWHVRKYDPVGALLWSDTYTGPTNMADYAYRVAIDSQDNPIVVGYTNKGIDSGANLDYDWLVIKYSAGGLGGGVAELLWTKTYESATGRSEAAQAVAVDGDDNIIVGGYVNDGAGNLSGRLALLDKTTGDTLGERIITNPANVVPVRLAYRNGAIAIGGYINDPAGTNHNMYAALLQDSPPPIEITSPADGETFTSCSYYNPPLFQWTLNEAFQKLEIRIFTPSNPAKPAKVKVKDPTATQLPMTQATWKKILKLPGLSGGELNWKIVGTNKGLPIVESDVFTMTIAAPEPAGKPDISPLTPHTATWGNACGTKFKAYFSADSAFSKSKKLSFKYQGSTNPDDPFSVTLPDKTWASLEKLVEGLVPARLYFYVESWDIIKRYQKTDVAYIDLDI